MDSVFLFSHLYEAAQDSLHNKMQTDVIHQMSSLYNYNRSQKEAAQERENTRKAKEMLRTLIFLAVLLIGAISWFYYRRQQKKKEMILNLENDLGNAILIREEIQEELKRLKEKDYESVIATKEKKEAELTQAIERLRAKNELYKRKSNENNTDRLDDFLNSSIAQLFIKKANNKTERPVPSDAEWRLLESQFSKDMPAIYNSFGHDKTLSSLEQYVCILLLLKIPTNAIIMMVKSSPQTVSKAKSRANMKLFNEKSANTLENNLLSSLKRS
jgi:preprotein translocase subunit YajC